MRSWILIRFVAPKRRKKASSQTRRKMGARENRLWRILYFVYHKKKPRKPTRRRKRNKGRVEMGDKEDEKDGEEEERKKNVDGRSWSPF